jgi:hypothetical protein
MYQYLHLLPNRENIPTKIIKEINKKKKKIVDSFVFLQAKDKRQTLQPNNKSRGYINQI